ADRDRAGAEGPRRPRVPLGVRRDLDGRLEVEHAVGEAEPQLDLVESALADGPVQALQEDVGDVGLASLRRERVYAAIEQARADARLDVALEAVEGDARQVEVGIADPGEVEVDDGGQVVADLQQVLAVEIAVHDVVAIEVLGSGGQTNRFDAL